MSNEQASMLPKQLNEIPRLQALNWYAENVQRLTANRFPKHPIIQFHGSPGSGRTTVLRGIERQAQADNLPALFVDLKDPEGIIQLQDRPGLFIEEMGEMVKPFVTSRHPAITEHDKPFVVILDNFDALTNDATLKKLAREIIHPLAGSGKVIVAIGTGAPYSWPIADPQLPEPRSSLDSLSTSEELIGLLPAEILEAVGLKPEVTGRADVAERLIKMTEGHPMKLQIVVDFFNENGLMLTMENLDRFGGDIFMKIKSDYVDSFYLKNDPVLMTAAYLLSAAEGASTEFLIHVLPLEPSLDSYKEHNYDELFHILHSTKPMLKDAREGRGYVIDPAISGIAKMYIERFHPELARAISHKVLDVYVERVEDNYNESRYPDSIHIAELLVDVVEQALKINKANPGEVNMSSLLDGILKNYFARKKKWHPGQIDKFIRLIDTLSLNDEGKETLRKFAKKYR